MKYFGLLPYFIVFVLFWYYLVLFRYYNDYVLINEQIQILVDFKITR